MASRFEVDMVVKGIETSWTTWGKMRGQNLVLGAVSYLNTEDGKGFERIYSVNIEENQDFEIQQMISFIKAGIMPDSILITPKTKPLNLSEILSEKGFSINDADPCMILHLDEYQSKSVPIDKFSVCAVTNKKQLATWLNIVNAALFEGELVTLDQFNDVFILGNTYFYLGLIADKPVTACMTIVDGNTSVLEMVATLSEYRRNGYASLTIDHALQDLKQKNIKTVSLRAEADGVGVYKRLGFKECFKRIIATCDWKTVYRKACPCHLEQEKIKIANQIFNATDSVESFIAEMERLNVVGRNIYYNPIENSIYITKKYACDCGGGCHANDTIIGKRCHCEYVNHLTHTIDLSYCNCAASFFEPMFVPLLGENIVIEPVKTVLSRADECVFRIRL